MPNNETLPQVRGHDHNGQWELVDPGPSVAAPPSTSELAEVDPRQGILPGVPGVRVGAAWRCPGAAELVPPQQLELRVRGLEQHSGRRWSERDVATREALRAQSWSVDTLRDRSLVWPSWMRGDVVDGPCGEIDLGRGARARNARELLAWVWCAFDAGAMGAWLSHDEWASVLGCSRRTVQRHIAWLVERGLVLRIETLQPCRVGDTRARGSADDRLLLRIGPMLEPLSLLPFARRHVAMPRRRGLSRRVARKMASTVREAVRSHGRSSTRAAIVRRRAYAGLGPATSVPSTPSSVPASVPRTVPSSAAAPAADVVGPLCDAKSVPRHGQNGEPLRPSPYGEGLGGGAVGPRGAAPLHPEQRPSSQASSCSRSPRLERDGGVVETTARATMSTMATTRRDEPRPTPERTSDKPAPERRPRRRAPRRPLADAAAELARALGLDGTQTAAEVVDEVRRRAVGSRACPRGNTTATAPVETDDPGSSAANAAAKSREGTPC